MTLFRYAEAPQVRSDGDGRTIFGIAVPYGRTVTVDDGSGPFREQFLPGAFHRSIAERGHKLKLFTQHDTRRLPVGRATLLEEHPDGLHASFTIAATRDGDDALELVTSGVVDGFSIGFTPVRDRRDPDGTVTRVEAALREVSLVHSPAYPDALVGGVRSTPHLSVVTARKRLALIDNKDW